MVFDIDVDRLSIRDAERLMQRLCQKIVGARALRLVPKPSTPNVLPSAQIRAYLRQHLAMEHRLPDQNEVAKFFQISPPTLRRYCQEAGIDYMYLLNEVRIEISTALLEQGLPVGAVSNMIGFSSPSGFSRFYSDFTGVRPSDLLKDSRGRPRKQLRPRT